MTEQTSYQILTKYKARVVEAIETYAAPWKDNGPSKETAIAIVKLIKRLPFE